MAGPSIMVRVLGDLTGLGKSFDTAATQGQSAAGKMHSAFSGMLGMLNSTGVLGPFGTALQTADTAMQNVSKHSKDIGTTMLGVGGAAAGLGLALSAMGSKDQAAHQQLQAAVKATGHEYDQYAGKVEAAITHQAHFGNSASQTQDALRVLTQATNSPTEALKLLNTATDLAAAKHEDLSTAATTLGKAYNGSGKVMKEFGITVSSTGTATKELATATKAHDKAVQGAATSTRQLQELQAADATGKALTTVQTMKLQDAQNKVSAANLTLLTSNEQLAKAHHDVATGASTNQKALDELGRKLSGQASAQADTFSGKLRGMRTEVENHVAEFGQKYGPALTKVGGALAGIGAVMKVTQGAMELFRATQVASTAATDVETVSNDALNASLLANPLTWIVIAIAALIAGIVLLATKTHVFQDIWKVMSKVALDAFNAVKNIALDVFHWLQANWPLLLSILAGPFGLAVFLIIKYWNDIWSFLTAIPAQIAALALTFWHWISDEFSNVLSLVQSAWNTFWGWLTGIPALIAALALLYWHWISDQFSFMLSLVQLIWGGFWGWLTGLPGQIAGMAAHMWDGISGAFSAAVGAISGVWSGIWSWFTGLPSAIASTAKGMWNGIANAFIDAVNAIINAWDSLHFHVPGFSVGPVSFGGFDLGVPHIDPIPHLAQGGLITQTGLIFAHAGEAVTPLPSRALGPAVNVEHAHFTQEIELDAFMRRAAWLTRTRRS
jgi:hypothetical protein